MPPSTPTPRVELALDTRAQLGECVLWCERTASLFWTDIEACELHRWWPATGERRMWPMPERLGSFALCETPARLLLGLASGIALFDLGTLTVGEIVPVEADLPTTRINDGRCDREGRFVFGTFNRARGGEAIGNFYRVWPDLRVERLPLPKVRVANGIAFSPDGRTMYFADSSSREIQCVEYREDGTLGEPRVFVKFAEGDGYPDGAVTDAEGGLWSAHWDGGCVVRYGVDGRETERVKLPVRRPACPGFGGVGLRELLVVTAREGLNEDVLVREPEAGGVLRIGVGVQGCAEGRFRT